jgi:hypothetical protein
MDMQEDDKKLPVHVLQTPGKETVVIFDWDDTLLASSFLSGRGYRLDSDMLSVFASEGGKEMATQLKELEMSVCQLMTAALAVGKVHVITNAETGWVQLSAAKFMPSVVPLLHRMTVISARSTYESQFPDCPLKWKFFCMQDRLQHAFEHAHTEKHVISFGDSHVEREAVRAVTRGFPNTRTKSVKFAERPSLEQLRRQLELVASCFAYIHSHAGDLDLQLTVTVNPINTPNSPAPSSPSPTSTPNSPADDTQSYSYPIMPLDIQTPLEATTVQV